MKNRKIIEIFLESKLNEFCKFNNRVYSWLCEHRKQFSLRCELFSVQLLTGLYFCSLSWSFFLLDLRRLGKEQSAFKKRRTN